EQNTYQLKNNNLLVDSNVKWTHHFLDTDELNFLENLKQQLRTVAFYAESKPGIVTAANNFFIINKEIEKKYNLAKYTRPIIQKGFFVNGSVVFNEENILELEKSNHPTRLLQLTDSDKVNKKLSEYLSIGTDQKIHERYKCKIRNNWYVIPNISTVPDALFFKRCHNYPKLLKNNSNALVTDSAYKINMKDNFDLNSFIFSFYNSLTLVFAETDGRYYGGGVLELTPSEFKKLPIPHVNIEIAEFENYTLEFENKENIEEILLRYDWHILNQSLGLNNEEILKIQNIRKKLIQKRMRS
ncbi:MAG: type I restriction endonuclease subunit M, partial [Flavobacterium sp.]